MKRSERRTQNTRGLWSDRKRERNGNGGGEKKERSIRTFGISMQRVEKTKRERTRYKERTRWSEKEAERERERACMCARTRVCVNAVHPWPQYSVLCHVGTIVASRIHTARCNHVCTCLLISNSFALGEVMMASFRPRGWEGRGSNQARQRRFCR